MTPSAEQPVNPYPTGSRHAGLATATTTLPDGRVVAHLVRRIVAEPDDLTERGRHEVDDGERLDHIAAAEWGDPTAWWLLVEGQVADLPADVVAEPGRRLRIVLPPTFGSAR